MVPKIFYGPVLHALRLMKFLSVRNRAPSTFMSKGPEKNIGGNELTLAGVVKEDLACPGSSLPKKKKKKKQASSDKRQALKKFNL